MSSESSGVMECSNRVTAIDKHQLKKNAGFCVNSACGN